MKKILLVLFLISTMVLITYGALSGTYTTNGYFYLPGYGEYGTEAFNEYNAYMQTADTQIEANKTMGEASVDTSGTPVANDIPRFTDLNTIEGLSYAELKAALDLEIGTDVLAQQSIGITDNYLLEVDGLSNANEYARFTANGLVGRTEAEFKGDFNLEIGTDVQAFDNALTSISGLTYISPSFIKLTANDTYAVRTIAETVTDLALDSDDLSDVASIAMLDEAETVTGDWDFDRLFYITAIDDVENPEMRFRKKRDGNPTSNVADNDCLGEVCFYGYYSSAYFGGAKIYANVDGTPGTNDMPTELIFAVSPDGSSEPVARMIIDNAGNVKMGDGANYVNITNAGVLTLEGTANIEGVDATEFSYLNGVTSDIQTQLGTKLANVLEDTTPAYGGACDHNNERDYEVKTVEFNGLYDNGNSGATPTVNWQNGQYQKIAVSENTLFTFSNAFIGTITLQITFSGAFTAGFNAGYTMLEEGGTEVSFTGTNGAVDILKVMYLGTANNYVVGLMADVKD